MRRILKILRGIGYIVCVILLLAVCIIGGIRLIKAEQIKIKTPNGIQEDTYVTLGGIQQYIQIRGQDKRNPIIIFLHGGPGSTTSYVSYYYQPDLESEYTFVNWDQRGAGRTYYRNKDLEVRSQLSKEILLNDLDELVDYVRDKFNQEQVIIMGHSWGTVLGSQYVLAHPEKVSNYIGIGQVVSLKDGYIYSAQEVIRKAKQQGDVKEAEQLEAEVNLFAQTNTLQELDFNSFIKLQQGSMKYNSYEGAIATPRMLWIMITSPELSWEDFKWFFKGNNPNDLVALQKPLLEECFFKFNLQELGHQYEVPMYYMTGACDTSTPAKLLEGYYETVTAPDKSMTCIPNTGHLVFLDNPKAFTQTVKAILTDDKTKKN